MKLCLFLLLLVASACQKAEHLPTGSSVAQDTSEPDWAPSLRAALSREKCETIPNFGFVDIPLGNEKFSLFYFTPKPIRVDQPWVLFFDGGPGGARIRLGPRWAKEVENVNFVVFHARGGGCSQLPPSESYDPFLNTFEVASDAELLRQNLGVERWQTVFGASYGTVFALNYASRFPARVSRLALEGVVTPAVYNTQVKETGMHLVLNRWIARHQSELDELLPPARQADIKRQIDEDIHTIWKMSKGPLSWLENDVYKRPLVPSRSNKYVMVLTELMYAGAETKKSQLLFTLFAEFEPALNGDQRVVEAIPKLNESFRTVEPFAYPDYDDISHADGLISVRGNRVIQANDFRSSPAVCTSVPIVAVQGDLDFATPAARVYKGLLNKKCFPGDLRYIEVYAGGHSPLTDPSMEGMMNRILKGADLPAEKTPTYEIRTGQ